MAKFSHIHINVSDLSKSLEFYGEKLGLKTDKITDTMGSVSLEPGSLDLDQVPIEKLSEVSTTKHTTLAFSVPSINDYYDEISLKGVQTLDKPTRRAWGSFNFYLKDPDGYMLEVEQQESS